MVYEVYPEVADGLIPKTVLQNLAHDVSGGQLKISSRRGAKQISHTVRGWDNKKSPPASAKPPMVYVQLAHSAQSCQGGKVATCQIRRLKWIL